MTVVHLPAGMYLAGEGGGARGEGGGLKYVQQQ